MVERKKGWIDVNELMPRVSIHDIAMYFRFDLGATFGITGEQRTRCPVASCDGHNDFRSVSVNLNSEKGTWKCHRGGYGCGGQGDKLTFAYCLEHGGMPPGGRLKGDAFVQTAKLLQQIAGGAEPLTAAPTHPTVEKSRTDDPPQKDRPNEPLTAEHLSRLDEQFIYDLAAVPAKASKYLRARPWLTEELQRAARCGYCPKSAKSVRRSQFVYAILNEEGEPLAWVGRRMYDPESPQDVADVAEKGKHVFPATEHFRRRFELYGQEDIADPDYAESLQRLGLVVVEGFNDRLRLKSLGVPAVAIMSNRVTDEQVEKLSRLAEQHAEGRLNLMWDANVRGDEGVKEALWVLSQSGLATRLVWSRAMFGGRFADREPESLSEEEWSDIALSLQ